MIFNPSPGTLNALPEFLAGRGMIPDSRRLFRAQALQYCRKACYWQYLTSSNQSVITNLPGDLMAKNSKIEWTHHTFNPWWGCTKVSAACKYCYAETWAKRVGSNVWGAKAQRRFFGAKHWQEPYRWNREAARQCERRRVFCASMADVFEKRAELEVWRRQLWKVIEDTPWLDWLLLTKRIELAESFVPWDSAWPVNIWSGTTVETQHWAEKRIPILLKLPAAIRFISCEPLLGPLDLRPWLDQLDWVIVGGESGHRARPMQPDWVRELRDQCLAAGVPFLFKQWGNWSPDAYQHSRNYRTFDIKDRSGNTITLVNTGKKEAGRELDGRTWDEVPKSPTILTLSEQRTEQLYA